LLKGMRLRQVRTGKQVTVNAPLFFFAKDRQVAEAAWPGDVVGIANHGTLRIGDTLTEGEPLNFRGVPSFAPEILHHVRLAEPMLAKKLKTALAQLAEEGVVQLFRPRDGSPPAVGVVGQLQLDVLQSRLKAEYGIPVGFDPTPWEVVRWLSAEDRVALERFAARPRRRGDASPPARRARRPARRPRRHRRRPHPRPMRWMADAPGRSPWPSRAASRVAAGGFSCGVRSTTAATCSGETAAKARPRGASRNRPSAPPRMGAPARRGAAGSGGRRPGLRTAPGRLGRTRISTPSLMGPYSHRQDTKGTVSDDQALAWSARAVPRRLAPRATQS
jgi:hypothetical protein